jgi:hypothetical protein
MQKQFIRCLEQPRLFQLLELIFPRCRCYLGKRPTWLKP